MVFQNKFNQGKNHQLSEKGFEAMNHLISNSLILAKNCPEEIEVVILLVKSTLHYYFNTNKCDIYLYHDLIRSHKKTWDSLELWFRWFELDLEENTEEDLLLLNKSPDDYYHSKLLGLFNKMKDLSLSLEFILSCLEGLCIKYIREEEVKQSVLIVSKKQFNSKKSY